MAIEPGTQLGPYSILSPIGAGGMGEVYKARDTRLNRDVAIKVLSGNLSQREDLKQRFEREAQTIAALNHPHICVLHDIGSQGGIDFLVMEYLEGETLAARLTRGPLPVDQAVTVALQIADALDKAHRKGVTHRDLKPGNIMVTSSGAKLLDFGLAKLRSKETSGTPVSASAMPTDANNLTAEGAIVGTLQYMAPEQLEGKEADPRTDIFALGTVIYEMVTGKKAFQGKSQVSLMAAILEHEPPSMSLVQPITPAALDRVVQICIAKDPDDRWQTAREVLRELKWSRDAAAPAVSPASATAATQSRRNWLWMVSLIGSVAAGIIFTVLAMRTPPQEARPVRFAIPPPGGNFGPAAVAPFPAISPDGRRIVMVVPNESGTNVLWVRSLDVMDAQPLRGTEAASLPFWSPDSRFIGFFADGKLKKIDVTGGPSQTLSETTANEGGTWNNDGTILLGSNKGPLFRVSASGGQAVPVTALDASQKETAHRWPTFLPDGKRFLYLAGSPMKVYAGSLGSNETKELTLSSSKALYAPPGYLLFVTDGTLMAQPFDAEKAELTGEKFPVAEDVRTNSNLGRSAFSVSDNGILTYRTGSLGDANELVWFDRSGKRLETVGPPSDTRGVALSPDQKRVAVHRHEVITGGDIWLMDLLRADAATRFTFNAAQHYGAPVWSPDLMSVVFTSTSPSGTIYQKNANGTGNEQELFKSDNQVIPWSWSRDGRFLIYEVTAPKAGADLWILPMSGDRKPTPFLQTGFVEHQAQFSPDGRSVAYASNESGSSEVYVRSFPSATGKWKVSTDGGASPRWRGDGKEIFFLTRDKKLWSVDVKSGPSTFEASDPKLLFETRVATPPTDNLFAYDVASDGQRFLITTIPGDISESITVVLNWHAGLTSRK